MTHYQVEVINMALNAVMTLQLGLVMVWTFRTWLECCRYRRLMPRPPPEVPEE